MSGAFSLKTSETFIVISKYFTLIVEVTELENLRNLQSTTIHLYILNKQNQITKQLFEYSE